MNDILDGNLKIAWKTEMKKDMLLCRFVWIIS